MGQTTGKQAGVPITWLWVVVAAIWGSALVTRPPAARWPGPPEVGIHVPTPWEQVARRYGDHRTDRQIRTDNALVFAVWNGDEAEARLALAGGADPNAQYLDPCGPGATPLMEASGLGHERLVGLLLEHRADPSLGYAGDTPLGLAVRAGHTAVARKLVAAGARDGNS